MLEILHETKDYLIVNKPSGLITETNPYEDSLEDHVYKHLSKTIKNVFIGVVHRLDRVTSGVVLFAKKKSALKYFNAQFEAKSIQKTYLAIVGSALEEPKTTLSHFLRKDQKKKMAVIYKTRESNSKPCSLSYKQVKQVDGLSLLEVKPQTGRFHQIRAQLAYVGSPIFGDEKYGSTQKYSDNQVCLHAWKLRFKDFESDTVVEFVAEHPTQSPWGLF
ncbi:MAG: RluA family pseudouridine synthase [Flavobacteriales bacterium]|nr:RluA family pseudouridine synthase [Flavobacteriales bacterium]